MVQSIKLAVKTIRITRIARSSLATEAIEMLDGLEATLHISELLKEIYENQKISIAVYDALQSSKYFTDKHLSFDIDALKEIIFNKEIKSIIWIKSAQKIAD